MDNRAPNALESDENTASQYPISLGLDLLLPELQSIEEAEEDEQIGEDWQHSSLFISNLWRTFREEFGLTRSELSKMDDCGIGRFTTLRESLHQLDGLINLLDVLTMAARNIREPVVAGLQRVGQKFGRSLQRLPPEILAETMRYACSDVFDLMKMSHVNRRFRQTVLGMSMRHIQRVFCRLARRRLFSRKAMAQTHEVDDDYTSRHPLGLHSFNPETADRWSHVSSDMPEEIIRLCLARGRNAPLHVVFNEAHKVYDYWEDFYLPPPTPDTPSSQQASQISSFIGGVARSHSRLKDIKFVMPRSREREFEYGSTSYILYVRLYDDFREMVAPRLESLSLVHQGHVPDFREFEEHKTREEMRGLVHFYRQWKATNLRALSFVGIVPMAIQGASIEALSLDIRVGELEMDFFAAIQDLLVFLRETPLLKSFRLCAYSSGVANSVRALDLPAVDLKRLEKLTFVVDYWDATPIQGESTVLLSSFVDRIYIPNLVSLRMKIALTDPTTPSDLDVTNLVDSFTPNLGGASSLEKLSIFVFDPKEVLGSLPKLSPALNRYPSLRSLAIGITGRLGVIPELGLHPNVKKRGTLKHVKLYSCLHGARGFLSWIADQLVGQKTDSTSLDLKVSVRKCGFVDKSRLLEFISRDNLNFDELNRDDIIPLDLLKAYGFYCGDDRLPGQFV